MEPEDEYFGQSYRLATAKLSSQLELLNELFKLMTRLETDDNRRFVSRAASHNMPNEQPEITVNHYFIESNIAKLS